MRQGNYDPRPCTLCKRVFTPTRTYQQFCCEQHRKCVEQLRYRERKGQREMRSRVHLLAKHCAHCGRIYQPYLHEQKYCSKRCQNAAYRRRCWDELVARRMLGAVD